MQESALDKFMHDAAAVWTDGGYLMVPLFILAFVIYFYALEMLIFFRREEYNYVDENTWGGWIRDPSKGKGHIGEIIRYSQDGVRTVRDVQSRFDEIKTAHLPRVEHSIIFLSILVTVAPLMGLLGTVMGMLTTFKGLASSSGQLVDVVAKGISEALITTQTGLVIAIPGYILVYLLTRRRQEQAAFLEHVESLTMQHFVHLPRSQRATLAGD
jgi:biopolymer transport protein ExbB